MNMYRKDLLDRLDRLDEDASLIFDSKERFRLVIVGGSALVLQEHLLRSTHDIDVLNASHEIIHLLAKYDIDCRVNAYICNFPYNYEDRINRLDIGGRRIDFYTVSLEDIVISKLYSSRPTDIHDIDSESVINLLDWDILEKLATHENETRSSAMNERTYAEFRQSYENYRRRHNK